MFMKLKSAEVTSIKRKDVITRNREYLCDKPKQGKDGDLQIYKEFWKDFSKYICKHDANKANRLLDVYFEIV